MNKNIDKETQCAMDKMQKLLELKELIESGFAGVDRNGKVVDVRTDPTAIKIQRKR